MIINPRPNKYELDLCYLQLVVVGAGSNRFTNRYTSSWARYRKLYDKDSVLSQTV